MAVRRQQIQDMIEGSGLDIYDPILYVILC